MSDLLHGVALKSAKDGWTGCSRRSTPRPEWFLWLREQGIFQHPLGMTPQVAARISLETTAARAFCQVPTQPCKEARTGRFST